MKKIIFLSIFLFSGIANATEICTTVDTSTWTQEQKNLRVSTAYSLAYATGQNVVPTLIGEDICFQDPSFNVSSVITASSLLTKIAQDESERQAAALVEQARIDAAKAELETNEVKTISLSQIDSRIDQISNLSDMKIFLKKMVRYIVAQREINQ